MKSLKHTFALILSLACVPALACIRSEGPPGSASDLAVIDPLFSFSENGGQRVVNTLGTIRNASVDCFSDVVIEVKYFDAKSNLIDTVTEPLYGVVVPGKQEVAFRVRDAAAQSKEAYVSQSVRVVSADVRTGRVGKKGSSSAWVELLISWGPMLLLISVWIFFMARMKRKDSPQGRTLAMFEQQNSILTSQNDLLARIASALEAKSSQRTDA